MTIDERLERLTERHEALTQSLELLTHDIRDMVTQNSAEHAKRDERMDKFDKLMGNLIEAVAKLLRVSEIHERRISRLEGH